MMRIVRGIGAALVWVLATVVLLLSLVLCITVIGLPLGIPLMLLGLRLYAYGVQLLVPRPAEMKRGARKRIGLRPRGSVEGDVKRLGKRGKRATKKMRKRARNVKETAEGKVGRRPRWHALVPGR
jgi:hypothetical protein